MSVFMGPGGHAVCYYVRGGALLGFVGIVETDEVSDRSLDGQAVARAQGQLCWQASAMPKKNCSPDMLDDVAHPAVHRPGSPAGDRIAEQPCWPAR